ncbi:uncharacterized protein [Parasteatoda tepidariorum]|uniref:uncharacterized protein n=1 Tax=Parasteatoda tepidariorum TaxID=114398 RepID=UPI00077F88EF|nr:protein pxr1-like [Parasteatoda tepidariorum]
MENKIKTRCRTYHSNYEEVRTKNSGKERKQQGKATKSKFAQNDKTGKAKKTQQSSERSEQDKKSKNKKTKQSTRNKKLNSDNSEKSNSKSRKKMVADDEEEENENTTETEEEYLDSDSGDSIAGYGEACRCCSRGEVRQLFENAGVELAFPDYVPRSLNTQSP